MTEALKQRAWCYVMSPKCYDITCDLCGGVNITWSEYESLIWCFDCEKDTPGTPGIFDGPIPLNISTLMGYSFDRFELPSGRRFYLHCSDSELEWKPELPKTSG
jgi:hypothetical protein